MTVMEGVVRLAARSLESRRKAGRRFLGFAGGKGLEWSIAAANDRRVAEAGSDSKTKIHFAGVSDVNVAVELGIVDVLRRSYQ